MLFPCVASCTLGFSLKESCVLRMCALRDRKAKAVWPPKDGTAPFPPYSMNGSRVRPHLREESFLLKSVKEFMINVNSTYDTEMKMITNHLALGLPFSPRFQRFLKIDCYLLLFT